MKLQGRPWGALSGRGRADDRECCRRGAGNTGGKRGGQRRHGRRGTRGAFRGGFGWASGRGAANQAVEAGSQKRLQTAADAVAEARGWRRQKSRKQED